MRRWDCVVVEVVGRGSQREGEAVAEAVDLVTLKVDGLSLLQRNLW